MSVTTTDFRSRLLAQSRAFSTACLLIAGLIAGPPALAQKVASDTDTLRTTQTIQNPVVVKLEQFKVVKNTEGREVLTDAKSVKPGEIIEYRASYTNQDKQAVKGLQATLPIPVNMHYLPKSAKPAGNLLQAATEAGSYALLPLMRQVTVNGKSQSEPVPYSQYRSLRWDVGALAAGATYVVSARAQVEGADEKPAVTPGEKPKTSLTGKSAQTATAAKGANARSGN